MINPLSRIIVSDELPEPATKAMAPAHVVFAGGGTAGHLFPGLAVAEYLRDVAPETRITFAGSGKDFERLNVTRAGFDYLPLPCQPLPRSAGQVWRFFADNLEAARMATRFVRAEHVAAVVGLGGYASVPMGRTAVRHRVPLLLLEQNAVPGRATRLLAPAAQRVCLAIAKAKLKLRTRGQTFVTGNPVRAGFVAAAQTGRPMAGEKSGRAARRLLILGGSGGSGELNAVVPKALHKVRDLLAGWDIVHQSGATGRGDTETLYRKFDLSASVVPFVLNMPEVLRSSDLVVCRAGGTTLAELAVTGVPAVIVPWTAAAADHQRRNAEYYTRMGAAVMLDPANAVGRLDDSLAELLVIPLVQEDVRAAMAAAMRRLGRPEATRIVVTKLGELLAGATVAAA